MASQIARLFAVAIFLNAGLLFWLEPLFAKIVLPLLGGAPAVWNACLLFYQVALLAGYAWAHVGPRMGTRMHAGVHVTLLAASIFLLPFAVSPAFLPPSYDAPLSWLLVVLLTSVGLPFFLIAANGPLLQRWFAGTRSRGSDDPYFLYAASNLGSVAALLLFPTFLERAFTLPEQSRGWQASYVAVILLVGVCSVAVWRRSIASGGGAVPAAAPPVTNATDHHAEAVSNERRLRWVALSAVPSSLMLGVTTYISTEIAPIPLVWIVPLALYLGTLVLAFAGVPGLNALIRSVFAARLAWRTALATGGALATAAALCLLALVAAGPRGAIVAAHLLLFFGAALVCHTQLADDRPSPARLTEYYFWLGVGGAAGGAFNALLGPVLFTSVLEYPLALAAVCMLLPSPTGHPVGLTVKDVVWPGLLGLATAAVPLVLRGAHIVPAFSPRLLLAIPAIACLAFSGRPIRFGLGLVAIVGASAAYPSEIGTVEHAQRNFYGVHRVLRDDANGFRWLTHGSTVHGGQKLSERSDPVPLTYYHPSGPLGDVFAALAPAAGGRRIAVIGLGAGSMVYYGRVGDAWTFYEIDPAVVAIARDRRFFTFLERPRPSVRMVLGDARLTIAADSAERYDMIVLDAFGADAVPVHLLTREVVQLYLERLAPGGLIAMHLSNRFLDLAPVAAGLAQVNGLHAVHRVDLDENPAVGKYRSHWVVLARNGPAALGALSRDRGWLSLTDARGLRPWSDDYSSILPLFRRGGGELPP